MEMKKINLKGIEVYPFDSPEQIIDFALSHPSILVAINAEKVLNATPQLRHLINHNIGYCDGIGPVLALHRMGFKHVAKVADCGSISCAAATVAKVFILWAVRRKSSMQP